MLRPGIDSDHMATARNARGPLRGARLAGTCGARCLSARRRMGAARVRGNACACVFAGQRPANPTRQGAA